MASDTAIWYVWVTSSQADYVEALCAKLIRRGWTVGPLARHLLLQYDDSPSCVVAMSIHRVPRDDEEKKEYTPSGVHSEICDVLKHIKGKFWSLVVSQSTACVWNIGNERISKDEKEKAEASKKVN